MAAFDREFITGAAGLVILTLLAEREMYGYEIATQATRRSARIFELKEGTVYPALHQTERAGLLKATWRESDAGRRRKYYGLTAKGRRQAESKRRQWVSLAAAMRGILGSGRA
jgi:PadR family transcriptional regulator PadR